MMATFVPDSKYFEGVLDGHILGMGVVGDAFVNFVDIEARTTVLVLGVCGGGPLGMGVVEDVVVV